MSSPILLGRGRSARLGSPLCLLLLLKLALHRTLMDLLSSCWLATLDTYVEGTEKAEA